MKNKISTLAAIALVLGIAAQQSILAKAGATDPIPGTSKSGVSSGGGGKPTVPAPTPTPPPTQPVLAAGPITFTTAGPVAGFGLSITQDRALAAANWKMANGITYANGFGISQFLVSAHGNPLPILTYPARIQTGIHQRSLAVLNFHQLFHC